MAYNQTSRNIYKILTKNSKFSKNNLNSNSVWQIRIIKIISQDLEIKK
jgi:hypothetical protein